MKKTTIGAFHDLVKSEMLINELRSNGISDSEISCIYTDREGNTQDSQEGEKIETGAVKGSTVGAVIGTIAGLVVANGILPGLGTVFVAGSLAQFLGVSAAVATTVAGAATGAVAGGVIGAFSEMGVSEKDATIYENHLKQGNVVVITRTIISSAKTIFEKHHGKDVMEYPSA